MLNTYWNTLSSAYTVDTIINVLIKKQIYVLCSQFRKELISNESNEGLKIRYLFVIKEFPNKFEKPVI